MNYSLVLSLCNKKNTHTHTRKSEIGKQRTGGYNCGNGIGDEIDSKDKIYAAIWRENRVILDADSGADRRWVQVHDTHIRKHGRGLHSGQLIYHPILVSAFFCGTQKLIPE